MKRHRCLLLAGLICALLRSANTFAACTMTIPSMTFPKLTSPAATADSMVTMHLECAAVIPPASKLHVCLSITAPRALPGPQPGGQQQLEYHFYSDAPRSQLWGCRGGGCEADAPEMIFDVSALGTVNADIPLYGRVIGSANLPNGDYSLQIPTTQSEIFRTANYSTAKLSCAALGNNALDTTPQFTVSAAIDAQCVVSADTIDFGSQQLQAEVTKYGQVRVRCPVNTSYSIKLGPGNNGSIADRRMKSGKGDTVSYSLRDSACGAIWGDGNSGTTVVTGTGNGSDVPHAICAVLPKQAMKPVGTYTDSVLVTVTY